MVRDRSWGVGGTLKGQSTETFMSVRDESSSPPSSACHLVSGNE